MTRCPRSVLIALAFCLAAGSASAIRAQDSPAQKEVRQRRLALLKTMNAHDIGAVRGFLDPSFSARTSDGKVTGFQATADAISQLFQRVPDVKEELKIERITVDGDTAQVTNQSTVTYTDAEKHKQSIDQRYVQVWQRLRKRWMLVSEREL